MCINLDTLLPLSPYKGLGPSGRGRPATVSCFARDGCCLRSDFERLAGYAPISKDILFVRDTIKVIVFTSAVRFGGRAIQPLCVVSPNRRCLFNFSLSFLFLAFVLMVSIPTFIHLPMSTSPRDCFFAEFLQFTRDSLRLTQPIGSRLLCFFVLAALALSAFGSSNDLCNLAVYSQSITYGDRSPPTFGGIPLSQWRVKSPSQMRNCLDQIPLQTYEAQQTSEVLLKYLQLYPFMDINRYEAEPPLFMTTCNISKRLWPALQCARQLRH